MSYRHTLSLAHNIPEVPYTLHLCTLLYIHKIIITWHTTYLHTLHYITYIHFLVYNRPYIHTNDIHTWQHAWDNHVYNPGMWGQWSDSSFLCWEKKAAVCVFPGCGLVGFDLGLWCENVCLSLWLNRIQIQNPHLDLHHKHATQLDLHSKTAMQIQGKITYLALAYNANHKTRCICDISYSCLAVIVAFW